MHHDENTQNTQATNPQESTGRAGAGTAQGGHLGESLLDLERIGRLWATHGIRIGVSALQTSAVTLTQLASTLANLAEGFKAQQEAKEEEKR